jgi:hypothetical protein
MGFLQAILGSLFSILGGGSLFFIAYKALTIGNDITEMKEILNEIRRGSRGGTEPSLSNYPAPLPNYEPSPVSALKSEREFVMPPPISRRLDAERGLTRDKNDDIRVRR